jgi:hypothetical protein
VTPLNLAGFAAGVAVCAVVIAVGALRGGCRGALRSCLAINAAAVIAGAARGDLVLLAAGAAAFATCGYLLATWGRGQ